MATTKPRVTVSFEPEVFDTISQMAELEGTQRSKIISSFFTQVHPELKDALELAKKIRADEKNGQAYLDQHLREKTLVVSTQMTFLAQELQKLSPTPKK